MMQSRLFGQSCEAVHRMCNTVSSTLLFFRCFCRWKTSVELKMSTSDVLYGLSFCRVRLRVQLVYLSFHCVTFAKLSPKSAMSLHSLVPGTLSRGKEGVKEGQT